jgi:exodeoxyribonuclease-5
MELSQEQQEVLDNVIYDVRVRRKPQVIYSGAAGTGKTTLLSCLADEFPDFAAVVWTGKAARRMQEVGISRAATIHSTIYRPVFEYGKLAGWELKDESDFDFNGFLVDESSTLSKQLYDDLMSFGLPCIFVGDHKQLEPIDSEFNLMAKPDYVLQEIHRNAGDIARFAEKLSRGEPVMGYNSPQVTLIDKRDIKDSLLLTADQVICAYNRTRVDINERIRTAMGKIQPVEVGDRVICLKNRKKQGLFNGMQAVVTKISGNRFDLDVDGVQFANIGYDPKQFGRESAPQSHLMYGPVPFDHAYCCTAHKFQGSEADRVIVYAQNCDKWDMKRWNYTSASRAKKHLIWAM